MPKKIIIRSDQLKNRAIEVIKNLPINPIHEIVIKPFKEIRSLAQNALYWKWLTLIGLELGMTKDELHFEYKERFLLPILIANPEDYPQFSGIMDSINAVRDAGLDDKADELYKLVIRLTSTTIAKTKHMTEYLNDIESHATSLGIYLPRPEDQDMMEW